MSHPVSHTHEQGANFAVTAALERENCSLPGLWLADKEQTKTQVKEEEQEFGDGTDKLHKGKG